MRKKTIIFQMDLIDLDNPVGIISRYASDCDNKALDLDNTPELRRWFKDHAEYVRGHLVNKICGGVIPTNCL